MHIAKPLGLMLLLGTLWGCSPNTVSETPETDSKAAQTDTSDSEGDGLLTLRANGEDFVRQGFVTKDGWQLEFDHVYVHLAEVMAYQADPAFQPDSDEPLTAQAEVVLVPSQTVDLAEGDATAEPIALAEKTVPAGRYNALSWQIAKATDGPAAEYSIVLVGTATQDDQTLPFTVQFDQTAAYTCGDYVGDERKGILDAGGEADLEATFHFDHLFGDGDTPPEDEINTGALGFEPLAALAQDGKVTIDPATLAAELSPTDYDTLTTALAGLAHVGEGHCKQSDLES
ncbi:MAG: DUF4382 domain-containing protein [Cyanobacteria bacterium P01_G01_bin.54]